MWNETKIMTKLTTLLSIASLIVIIYKLLSTDWPPIPLIYGSLLINWFLWISIDLYGCLSIYFWSLLISIDRFIGCSIVVLPEDAVVAGFVPLLALSVAPVYVSTDIDKVRAL